MLHHFYLPLWHLAHFLVELCGIRLIINQSWLSAKIQGSGPDFLSFNGTNIKMKWVGLTSLGVEIVGFGETEKIRSLTAAWIQSLVPGHGTAGDKLIAGISLGFLKQSLATFFCNVIKAIFCHNRKYFVLKWTLFYTAVTSGSVWRESTQTRPSHALIVSFKK